LRYLFQLSLENFISIAGSAGSRCHTAGALGVAHHCSFKFSIPPLPPPQNGQKDPQRHHPPREGAIPSYVSLPLAAPPSSALSFGVTQDLCVHVRARTMVHWPARRTVVCDKSSYKITNQLYVGTLYVTIFLLQICIRKYWSPTCSTGRNSYRYRHSQI